VTQYDQPPPDEAQTHPAPTPPTRTQPTPTPRARIPPAPQTSDDPLPYSYPQVHSIVASNIRAMSLNNRTALSVANNSQARSGSMVTYGGHNARTGEQTRQDNGSQNQPRVNYTRNPAYMTGNTNPAFLANNEENQRLHNREYQSVRGLRGAEGNRGHLYDYPQFENQGQQEFEESVNSYIWLLKYLTIKLYNVHV